MQRSHSGIAVLGLICVQLLVFVGNAVQLGQGLENTAITLRVIVHENKCWISILLPRTMIGILQN